MIGPERNRHPPRAPWLDRLAVEKVASNKAYSLIASEHLVRCSVTDGVASLTLCSPGSGNALSATLVERLSGLFQQVTREPSCRVVVIRAEGTHFCRGLDIGATFADGQQPERRFLNDLFDCFALLCKAEQPVIAAVEGEVTGGGVGLVAACDLVIAAPCASFLLPEVVVGMIPALIAPYLLRRVTPGRLRYMALSSRRIGGAEAHGWGLVDELALPTLEASLDRQMKRLLRSSPRAIGESKRYFDELAVFGVDQHRETAVDRLSTWLGQDDVADHVRQFASGVTPPWFQRPSRNRG